MVSRFDPVPQSHCHLIKVPYVTPATAATEDEILNAYDYPKGLWIRFYHQVCDTKKVKREGKRQWPLALFSAGLNTTRLFSNHLAHEIASHGFTVITIDHPYDTDVVEFPNGDVIYGGRVIKPANANGSTASVEHALEVRADDASFVLDHLKFKGENALMFGHSFGGAASATALLNDKRFRAGVNIDGMMFGPVLNTSLGSHGRQAFMLWGSDGHDSFTDPTWAQFWATLNSSADVDYKKEFTITNGSHGSYWDLNILVDVAGIRDELSDTAQSLLGPILGQPIWNIMGRYLPAFFWYALGLKPEDEVLKGPSEEFPAVKMLHG
ncbi:Alpha/Beta hydrolase protein [Phaeosphaeriaceae sp. PMI808]|nr:Alpha/Beta hydrolase protein [Phaeosphaeriaceae sp. PMI808]